MEPEDNTRLSSDFYMHLHTHYLHARIHTLNRDRQTDDSQTDGMKKMD